MKVLEKLYNAIGKRMGYVSATQVHRSLASRSVYKAASQSRLFADWTTSTTSADADARSDLVVMRARARDVRRNYEYGRKFGTLAKTNVLGEYGGTLRNKAKFADKVQNNKLIPGPLDVFANTRIQDAWWEAGKKDNWTVTKKLCRADADKIILDAVLTDGEHLIRKVKGFDNPFKFAIQLLESDHLDVELNRDLGNGRRIVMGVELDQWKAPVAYYILKDNPNDWFYTGFAGNSSFERRYTRLDVSEIVHPFLPERANQTRGFPWLATPLPSLMRLNSYEEAELVASDAAACKMGVIKTTGDVEYAGPTDEAGNKTMEAQPGHIEQLPAGLEFQPIDWQHPNSNYAGFVKACLRRIAAGLGVSYNTLGEDMESVNFASGKLSLDAERAVWKCLQNFFGENVSGEIFPDWLEAALMSWPGLSMLPFSKFDKFNSPAWQFPGWSQVNPVQEMAAIETKLRLGLISPSEVIISWGKDPTEVWDQIEKDREEMEARGIDQLGSFSDKLQEMALEQQAEEAKMIAAAQSKSAPAE